MDKTEALDLITVVKPLVQYIAASGNGEHLAKVIEATNEEISDKEREEVKVVLTLMAKVARTVQDQKQAR